MTRQRFSHQRPDRARRYPSAVSCSILMAVLALFGCSESSPPNAERPGSVAHQRSEGAPNAPDTEEPAGPGTAPGATPQAASSHDQTSPAQPAQQGDEHSGGTGSRAAGEHLAGDEPVAPAHGDEGPTVACIDVAARMADWGWAALDGFGDDPLVPVPPTSRVQVGRYARADGETVVVRVVIYPTARLADPHERWLRERMDAGAQERQRVLREGSVVAHIEAGATDVLDDLEGRFRDAMDAARRPFEECSVGREAMDPRRAVEASGAAAE